MKKAFVLVGLFVCLLSCTKSSDNLLNEISGVWRAKQWGLLVTINYESKNLLLAIGDKVIPITLGEVDNSNKTVNINVTVEDKPVIWTLKQIWDKDKKNFHLMFTFHDGTQEELSFVRKITAEDLKKLSADLAEEHNNIALAGIRNAYVAAQSFFEKNKLPLSLDDLGKNGYKPADGVTLTIINGNDNGLEMTTSHARGNVTYKINQAGDISKTEAKK